MNRLLLVLVLLPLSVMHLGCETSGDGQADDVPADTTDNSELRMMYEADQADRTPGQGEEIDWPRVMIADSTRRARVREMLDSNLVRTADDYYHAAMVFQHGNDTTSARMAHELAATAVELDSTHENAKWMTAAAWDRYLMRKGEPQWYGTQFVKDTADEPWRLYDVDTTRVTDEDRIRLGVPPLAESRERVREMNEN